MDSILRDDLFLMLRHGSALFAEEIEQLAPTDPAQIAWRSFVLLLVGPKRSLTAESLPRLRSELTAVREASATQ